MTLKKRRTNELKSKDGELEFKLYEKMMEGKASSREIVYLSLLRGMITEEQYARFLEIEKSCNEYD